MREKGENLMMRGREEETYCTQNKKKTKIYMVREKTETKRRKSINPKRGGSI